MAENGPPEELVMNFCRTSLATKPEAKWGVELSFYSLPIDPLPTAIVNARDLAVGLTWRDCSFSRAK